MPWSRTEMATENPSTWAENSTLPPSSEYFTALSSRLNRALVTWRRSQATRMSPAGSVSSMGVPAASAVLAIRSVASAMSMSTAMSSRSGDSWASRIERSSRSTTVRSSRSDSWSTRPARRRSISASSSPAIVSASSPRAPIGVLSSWLTLATKSRRMFSIRRASETSRRKAAPPIGRAPSSSGTARTWSTLRGGPNSRSSRSPSRPRSVRSSSSQMASAVRASPPGPVNCSATPLRRTISPRWSTTTIPSAMWLNDADSRALSPLASSTRSWARSAPRSSRSSAASLPPRPSIETAVSSRRAATARSRRTSDRRARIQTTTTRRRTAAAAEVIRGSSSPRPSDTQCKARGIPDLWAGEPGEPA